MKEFESARTSYEQALVEQIESDGVYIDLYNQLTHESLPPRVDAVYLPGLSKGMIEAAHLFDIVARMVKDGRAGTILYSGSDGRGMPPNDAPGFAWPGASWYREELISRGVPSEVLIPTGMGGYHTRLETDELASYVRDHKLKSVAIATVPYHVVRSLSSLVGSMESSRFRFPAYYIPTGSADWDKVIVGSQGVGEQSFIDEARAETRRVKSYWDKGRKNDTWKQAFGAPPEVMQAYLSWRNLHNEA